jgi:hypothetical protein
MKANFWRITLLSAALLTAAVLFTGMAPAGKPGGGGGGGSQPTGQIYYSDDSNSTVNQAIYMMNDDGSGKTQALPKLLWGDPSSKVYNGSRWWITISDPATGAYTGELYAYRYDGAALQTVQLTNVVPDGLFLRGPLSWSNDGNDSFLTVGANTNLGPATQMIVRLPITGDEIASLQAPLMAWDLQLVVETSDRSHRLAGWGFSPNADILAYMLDNYDIDDTGYASYVDSTILIRVLPTNPGDSPVDVPIYTGRAWAAGGKVLWSPNGSRIAFQSLDNWGQLVATIAPDGSGYTETDWHLTGVTTQALRATAWSPDSKELLILFDKTTKPWSGVISSNIYRAPATGGKPTLLTGDLPDGAERYPVAWFPLSP